MITKIILLLFTISLVMFFYLLKKSAQKKNNQPHKPIKNSLQNFDQIDNSQTLDDNKFIDTSKTISIQDNDNKQRHNQNNNSNQKESFNKENVNENLNEEDKKQLDEIIEKLKKTQIRPMSNQQRNLDREEGGLENEIKETELHTIDEWDSRNDDIVAMGKDHPINNSSAKKSMLWNLKRKKLQDKKIKEELENASDDLKKLKNNIHQQESDEFDSRKKQSLTQRISALKQDRTDFKPPSKIR